MESPPYPCPKCNGPSMRKLGQRYECFNCNHQWKKKEHLKNYDQKTEGNDHV